MLKSSNLNSIINELTISDGEREMETQQEQQPHPVKTPSDPQPATTTTSTNNAGASSQLSAGILAIAEPPLDRVRGQLKELIGRQNKIYIDLSKEKYKLDCSEVAKLNDMMNDVKRYKEKLTRIKKEMQNVYQRTKDLKKRAANVAACKQRDYQRKLEKQQHEESLIGSQGQ
ncbi:uncharacterized protein Dwil_GK12407 [Drosophila willistoni]|uniref:Biogenesis of lysosome-related organelles complex 1 subunit 6 n=1 Tax=Drosophila willistoni TaxID=7260 RepID=B4N4M1_DROWI|nr:biogenesis of lysosome-related organelles complex 1 subunit 6 isoform X1 [Drosophila willistoni]XP_046867877.1 biogenesis of lysosome-related organelles complex 1 subunit 6 isoform X1 [Drosophila willistoni]EDW79095.2 uncharacterized protein Dwil_GK12407 [Drosophila willistoni]